jgi:hypothetical protein
MFHPVPDQHVCAHIQMPTGKSKPAATSSLDNMRSYHAQLICGDILADELVAAAAAAASPGVGGYDSRMPLLALEAMTAGCHCWRWRL